MPHPHRAGAKRAAIPLSLAAVVLAAMALALAARPAAAAPEADLWPRWQAHEPTSTKSIDHGPWTRLLRTYVVEGGDGVNRFRYAAVSPDDRSALEAYVSRLAATPISAFNRAEQFAYWVNLYNALTIQVVLDHYPVDSIRDIDISPGLFADGPWGAKLLTIEDEAVSLDDIEHRILRPIWREPRIHYVVNCAAIGCPDLHPEALTADNAERIMRQAAITYVNHPRGARIEDGELIVSSIYAWFEEDFGDSEAAVVAHLRRYAEPPLKARLAGRAGYDDYEYDWRLNDV